MPRFVKREGWDNNIGKINVQNGVLVVHDISSEDFIKLFDECKEELEKNIQDGIDGVMVFAGREIEYISFEDKGIKLWRELINYLGDDPFVNDTTDYGRDPSCFFCSAYKPNHEPDCIYVRAKELCRD